MKKIILTLIVSWIGLNISAQSFDTYIKHNKDEIPVHNSISLPNNEYIVGAQEVDTFHIRNNIAYKIKTILYKLSNNGTKVDSMHFPFPVESMLYKNKKVYFIATGNVKNSINKLNDTIIIGIINPTLMDTLNTKRYITSMKTVFSNDLEYFNFCNCLTFVGKEMDSNNRQYPFIFQFDTLLNVKKQNRYMPWFTKKYGNSSSIFSFYSVLKSPSQTSYWLTVSEALDSDKVNGWAGHVGAVVAIDSNLNRDSTNIHSLLTNQKNVYNPGYAGLRTQPFDGTRLTDTTYLFAGAIEHEDKNLKASIDMAYLIVDTNFNLIKNQFWGKIDTLDMATWNTVDQYDKYVYIFNTSAIMERYANYFVLTKVDLAGNRLWTKYYSSGTNIQGFSVLATSDGGALMTGESYDANKGTGYEKDMFILKVDSNGNGPGLLTSLSKLKIVPKSNYLIYPNPLKNELHLLKVNTFGNYTFTLYDAFGREVKSTYWTEDEQIMPTTGLAAGVYIYRIKDKDGRMASGKIVKQ